MKPPILRTAVAGFAAGSLCWASWRLIRISKRCGATDSETVRDLPGELLPQGRSTTYAISIAAPAEKVWPWLVQIGRGRGGFYTYTAIERLLGADIDNLDRIDPSLQTLKPGDRIWMTPERYLRHLPGQFGRYARCSQGGHLFWNKNRPRARPAIWSFVLQPAAGGTTRLLDRHRSEPRPGPAGSLSDAFWSLPPGLRASCGSHSQG
jgi:hypothetical protein